MLFPLCFFPSFPSLWFHFSLFVLSRWKESLSILRRVLDPKINCLTMYLLHSELMSHQTLTTCYDRNATAAKSPSISASPALPRFLKEIYIQKCIYPNIKTGEGFFSISSSHYLNGDIFKAVLTWYLILNPRPSTTTLEEEIRVTRLHTEFFLITLNSKMLMWTNRS